VAAIAALTPGDKRGQVIEIAGATILNDSYNSNPEALLSMIRTLAARPAAGHRILVAGEMLEMGEYGPRCTPSADAPPPRPGSISLPACKATPSTWLPPPAPVELHRCFFPTRKPQAAGLRRICALATSPS